MLYEVITWQVIDDITFRSVTLTAVKPASSAEHSGTKTVMYRGPFAAVIDESGQRFDRGSHETVSAHIRQRLLNAAYGNAFIDLSDGMTGEPVASCCGTAKTVNIAEPQGQAGSHGGCCS